MNRGMFFEFLGALPGIGRLSRWFAGCYGEGSVTIIRSGPAAGYRWKRYHRYVNGYWLGHYERPIQKILEQELGSGDVFFDVGAHAGFFTLVAARLVGPTGCCVAFDPRPDNCACVTEQIQLNGLTWCRAVAVAIGPVTGKTTFLLDGPGGSMGHLGTGAVNDGAAEVEALSLDDAGDRFGRPDFVKMDIEGAEAKALEGARKTLYESRPGWLIECHSQEAADQVREILTSARYEVSFVEPCMGSRGPSYPCHLAAHPLA